MKRIVAGILVLMMVITCAFAAELPDLTAYTDEELVALAEAISAEQENRGSAQAESAAEPAVEAAPERATLQKGSKGEDVRQLQLRLIELNYLSGGADGDYGGKTKAAVELFQKEANMDITGIADAATQDALYADDAPVATVYLDLDFTAISRDPDKYAGKNYKFGGRVLQVMEQDVYGVMTYVVMRIATRGNYDNVVYVTYYRDADESRILEDDRVMVYGTCEGLYTYETVIGGSVTLPEFTAETVTVQ